MDVFMIGNGFDLHHCLPTTYTCFLNVVGHINRQIDQGERLTSVSQIISEPDLLSRDKYLERCYAAYGDAYDAELDPEELAKLFSPAKTNLWFSHLSKTFKAGDKWIDFEQEIGIVVNTISVALDSVEAGNSNQNVGMWLEANDQVSKHVCSCFPFFCQERSTASNRNETGQIVEQYCIKKQYAVEQPFGSGRYIADKKEIINHLYTELRELANMLAAYLILFVAAPVKNLCDKNKILRNAMLSNWSWQDAKVVSFNYTHTLESIYFDYRDVYFLHGQLQEPLDSKIVLGIDADEKDELGSSTEADVTLIQFKKYFQRVFFRTDLKYISFVQQLRIDKAHREAIRLYVIGHSLDKTDREVIKELFWEATAITVFYHDESAVSDYIRNLVTIFGKKEFDALRTKRHLRFLPLEAATSLNPVVASAATTQALPET